MQQISLKLDRAQERLVLQSFWRLRAISSKYLRDKDSNDIISRQHEITSIRPDMIIINLATFAKNSINYRGREQKL